MSRMRIYVAGRLGGFGTIQYIQLFHTMIEAGLELIKKGHAPYIPALDFLCGLIAGDWEYEDYYRFNLDWVGACHAILLLPGWKESRGANRELVEARRLGLKIYYRMEDVPQA